MTQNMAQLWYHWWVGGEEISCSQSSCYLGRNKMLHVSPEEFLLASSQLLSSFIYFNLASKLMCENHVLVQNHLSCE